MKKIIGFAIVGYFYSCAATAYISPGTVRFQNIRCHSSATEYVTYTNNTGQEITNLQVSVSGLDFDVSGSCPYSLPAYQSCNIRVTYRPMNSKSSYGTLYVRGYPSGYDTAGISGSCN